MSASHGRKDRPPRGGRSCVDERDWLPPSVPQYADVKRRLPRMTWPVPLHGNNAQSSHRDHLRAHHVRTGVSALLYRATEGSRDYGRAETSIAPGFWHGDISAIPMDII